MTFFSRSLLLRPDSIPTPNQDGQSPLPSVPYSKKIYELDILAHACSPSTQEAEAGKSLSSRPAWVIQSISKNKFIWEIPFLGLSKQKLTVDKKFELTILRKKICHWLYKSKLKDAGLYLPMYQILEFHVLDYRSCLCFMVFVEILLLLFLDFSF